MIASETRGLRAAIATSSDGAHPCHNASTEGAGNSGQ
jgi:hypothetical protein